jgi:predicted alpha/beta hydrolase
MIEHAIVGEPFLTPMFSHQLLKQKPRLNRNLRALPYTWAVARPLLSISDFGTSPLRYKLNSPLLKQSQKTPEESAKETVREIAVSTATQDDVFSDDITIPAMDGYPLAATLFLPRGEKRNAVVISSATATPRRIYRSFAAYLAHCGFAVLTYDYRGIGESRGLAVEGCNQPKSLVGFKASMADWAALDATAAVGWMRERYHELPLSYVGHSFGGQTLGLLPNNSEVSRALFVSAQAASWKLMASPERYRVAVFMSLIGVALTYALGYAPGRVGIGEDLPKGVFLQWARWVMSPHYLFDDTTLAGLKNFPNFKGSLRALTFTDDPWAPHPAVELLCNGLSGTAAEIILVNPAELGVKKIGHFGFFRPEHRDALWRGAAGWLAGE